MASYVSEDFDEDSHESSDTESQERDNETSKAGLASVMAGILGKKKYKKNAVILAKGKTDKQIAFKRQQTEETGQTDESSVSVKKSKVDDADVVNQENKKPHEERLKRTEWNDMGRVKPTVYDRELERKLQRIATRGVVQLFNAVRKQQKDLAEKISEAGPSIRKQDEVMKSISKGEFLDMLKGSNQDVTEEQNKKINDRLQKKDDDSTPSWNILRDDFMMGASMKDWDKTSNGSLEEDNDSDPDMDNIDSSDDNT